MKDKPAVRIIGLASMLSFLCTIQLSDRITTAISPNTFAAQLDHIEILSYQMGIGLIPGQSLRITVFDPNRLLLSNAPGESARARVKLFLADGTPIRQSPAFLIPEGGFNFVEFHRPDIPVPGDALTGRVQILAKAFLSVRDPRASDLSLVSGEVIDATTGKTLVYTGLLEASRSHPVMLIRAVPFPSKVRDLFSCTGGPPWPPLLSKRYSLKGGAATEGRPYRTWMMSRSLLFTIALSVKLSSNSICE